jgi:hypothetical protein
MKLNPLKLSVRISLLSIGLGLTLSANLAQAATQGCFLQSSSGAESRLDTSENLDTDLPDYPIVKAYRKVLDGVTYRVFIQSSSQGSYITAAYAQGSDTNAPMPSVILNAWGNEAHSMVFDAGKGVKLNCINIK